MPRPHWLHPLTLTAAAIATLTGCDSLLSDHGAEQGAALKRSGAQVDVAALHLRTQPLAAQAGYYARHAPGQPGAFNGADLGWAFVHRDKIWVMFGDSWWIDPVNAASRPDDALGQISLSDFPDGSSVDAFVRAHPAPWGQPAWRATGPTMPVILSGGPGSGFDPVVSTRDGRRLPSGIGNVPEAAFSNGRDDAGEGVFAVFFNYEPVECVQGACEDGFVCDAGLSRDALAMFQPACVVGSSPSCLRGPGLCQDRTISMYEPNSDSARAMSVVLRHHVGATTAADPTHFKAQAWPSTRFSNASARTVSDFDPTRADGVGNDYTPARGNTLPRAGVFIWGRPQFGGIGAAGRDAQLYLLWAPLPALDSDQHFDWQPQYFTGLDSQGRPQFTARQVDAQPLDLDADTPGVQPEEARDVVGQMGITWLPSLERFVMFYGGEGAPMFGDPIFGADGDQLQHDPQGSLFVRYAPAPWGPWTTPRPFFAAGVRDSAAEAVGQYGPGGILAHDNCHGPDCARAEPAYLLDPANNNNGSLYGASFIDAWTTAHDSQTDVYWFLSTWNPYQVVLMKTTFAP